MSVMVRFVKAWIALGFVLSAQQENDHASTVFRTASRLLPCDHRPKVFMAREMVSAFGGGFTSLIE